MESLRLASDIEAFYDLSKVFDFKQQPNGSYRFSLYVYLGLGEKKRFRTVWAKDSPDAMPRLITAHRE